MIQPNDIIKESSSFRDNDGYVFYRDGRIYRFINESYKDDYDLLISSGLSKKLIDAGYLIDFNKTDEFTDYVGYESVLKVDKIPFLSFPYEWSFSMLKDAAMLTLKIQKIALSYGMTLKDASAYNVQFFKGKPIFIDITSFTKNEKGQAWVAYQQFCRHFIAPLVLMSTKDISLNKLMLSYIDGIPIELTSKLLNWTSKFNLNIYLHIHLHTRFIQKHNNKKVVIKKSMNIDLNKLCDNLIQFVESFKYKIKRTEWGEYYEESVDERYLIHKEQVVLNYIDSLSSKIVWDIGANDGTISKLVASKVENVISTDIDHTSIEKLYKYIKYAKIDNIQPAIIDIINPSPGIGWNNSERKSFFKRVECDTIVVLAVIHHLRITHQIPLELQAKFFAEKCLNLIIEFVPKDDEKVKILLQNRKDIFDDYTLENFTKLFENYFTIISSTIITGTTRTIFQMSKNE